MITGQPKSIGLPPIGAKDLDPKENFVPFHIDLRNGRRTTIGNWANRPGFNSGTWSTGESQPIHLLVPEGLGYAVTGNGKVFQLKTTPVELTGANLSGGFRPQFKKFSDDIILVDGGPPVKITSDVTALLGGSPPSGKYIGRVGSYTLMAGQSDTGFAWSASNNPENWTTGDSGDANVKKDGKVMYATSYRQKWLIWKDNEIEVWHNRGGSTPFVRLNESGIPKGTSASYSVVIANQIPYWFGTDFKFYVLSGVTAQSIAEPYDGYIKDRIQNPSECYGFDFTKENVIRWFFPTDGICLKYDYLNQFLSEDNTWNHGQFERLPINSYMELNNRQYFGDFEPTGKVFEWSEDNRDDNGTEIRVLREFKVKLTESGNNAIVNRLRFMLERGVDTSSETNPHMLFRWRFDEDAEDVEWRTETISLGIGTDTQPYVDLFGLGLGHIMHIQIIENDAVDFLLLGMLITTKELTI